MSKSKILLYSVVSVVFLFVVITLAASTAPGDFPVGGRATVKKGASISETADLLKDKGFIRSTMLFNTYTRLFSKNEGIKAGHYFFTDSESVFQISSRMIAGEEGIPAVKVTIPEGLATPDIARLIKKLIPTFDSVAFLKLAQPLEGYLFPDTYFWNEFTTPEEVIKAMRDNFDEQVAKVQIPGGQGSKSFRDVIIMASLLEEEASSTEDRRIISGILWKRLAAKMPLQVDATFFYLMGKSSEQLTMKDLATSSPYNLYKNRGLPPTPIDNPSLDAIRAAVTPVTTKYWFFLAGKDGKVHYAETLEGHVVNKKYLR